MSEAPQTPYEILGEDGNLLAKPFTPKALLARVERTLGDRVLQEA